jgi:hypothetical protein
MSEDVRKLIEREKQLAGYQGEDAVISSHDLQTALREERADVPEWSLKADIPTLNDCITDFRGGEVSVASGITGEGKTLLYQTFTHDFADDGHRSLWFSYEVRPELFLSQFGDNLPLFYMPGKLRGKTLPWIRTRVHEAKVKYGIKAVFIDHLHYLLNLSTGRNVSLEIGGLMRGIVEMAHDFNLHFFVISHMKKVSADSEPNKGDARDSSFVEQEADNVFYIWRLKGTETGAMLKIAKNRRRGVFDKKIRLDKVGHYLREVERIERY